jgi:hypothetical protein
MSKYLYSIYFIEFFNSLSFLKKEDWKKISKLVFEKNLKKKFVNVVYFFAKIIVLKENYFNYKFCDSILTFSLFFESEIVVFFVVFSTLENSANDNQSLFISIFSMKKENLRSKKKLFLLRVFLSVFLLIRWLRVCLFYFFNL